MWETAEEAGDKENAWWIEGNNYSSLQWDRRRVSRLRMFFIHLNSIKCVYLLRRLTQCNGFGWLPSMAKIVVHTWSHWQPEWWMQTRRQMNQKKKRNEQRVKICVQPKLGAATAAVAMQWLHLWNSQTHRRSAVDRFINFFVSIGCMHPVPVSATFCIVPCHKNW